MAEFKKRVQRLVSGILVAVFLVTAGFSVATVYAGSKPGNCCGDSSCEVLDGYWIHCNSSGFCEEYTPNFPQCCAFSPGFCAEP